MNRRIFLQVIAPALAIGLLLLGACLVSAWYITRLQKNMTRILSQNVASLRAAQELEIKLRQLRFHSFLHRIDPDHAPRKPIVEDRKEFREALSKARELADSPNSAPESRRFVRSIEEGYQKYLKELSDTDIGVGVPPVPPRDYQKWVDDHPIRHIVEPCQKLLDANWTMMNETFQRSESVSSQARLTMFLIGVIGPIGGLIIGYGMARGLSRSIYQLSVRVQDMAQRLDQDVASVHIAADGDLRSLDKQLDHVVRRVEEVAQRLQRHQREMLRAEQLSAVGQLAAGVAHEIRNPLTSVNMLVDAALRSNNRKPLTLEDLQVIHGEISRLKQTVQGFLDFARPPTLQRSLVPLREVINQALDLVRVRARQQQVETIVRAPAEPVPVNVDQSQLCTVLVNLFLNALDALPQGGRLDVEFEILAGTGVCIRVQDTGSGISPDILSRLFTPFASSKATGTGLGLSISRRIIEEHGGTLTGSNRPEGGACFTIVLPAWTEPANLGPESPSGLAGDANGLAPPARAEPFLETPMPTLLVIDDEQSVRYSFRRVFEGEGVQVLTAGTAGEGLVLIQEHAPDVIVLDLQLPDRSGLDLFKEIHRHNATRPVIFITAHGTTETAIEAMKTGAFDYLVKPVDLERLSQVLGRAFEAARLMHVPAALPTEDPGDRIVGRSLVMQEMCKAIGRIAPQDVNVLILGESGTGKELVARALYQHSRRAAKPFLAINCAALPDTLLESELFGHEQGAFTGAQRRRIGKFEQCHDGTLFLDEIGDMAPALQAKILRVLQEQRFERLGSNETVQTRVRVLAATNHDLEQMVEEGTFRKDLYYRLKVITIRVPPLRERLDDVAELAHYFLFRFDRELGLDLRGFAPETLALLQSHGWPGNVRELQSAIKEAMLNVSGHIVLPEFLPESLQPTLAPLASATPATSAAECLDLTALIEALLQRGETNLYPQVIESVERILLARVLRHTHGHQAQASELLGLNRATLRHKLRALGLIVDKFLVEEK